MAVAAEVMTGASVYRATAGRPVIDFVRNLAQTAAQRGFVVHNEASMDMTRTFAEFGIAVRDDFDLHMVKICKPGKAAGSLQANPERGVLMPKYVVAFSTAGVTQVRFLRFGSELVQELVGDQAFASALNESYIEIVAAIEAAL